MTSRDTSLPSFDPPSVGKDPEYSMFLYHSHQYPAQKLVKRFRAAGLDAFMEKDQRSRLDPSSLGMFLYNVMVAKNHLLCAFVVWRLRGRNIEAWRRKRRDQRCKIAEQAIVDCALRGGGRWDLDAFTIAGLRWLQWQLGMETNAFRSFLFQARAHFEYIGKRDLRWGLWLSAAFLTAGIAWGWAFSFISWPVWVLALVAAVLGIYTLTYSWPRAIRIDKSRSGIDYQGQIPEEPSQTGRSGSVEFSPYTDRKSKMTFQEGWESAVAEDVGMNPDMARSMNKAKEFLNRGEADTALKSLEAFMTRDVRGLYMAFPEFNKLLFVCQEALGKDTRNIESRIWEMGLDWLSALKKGEESLRKGKVEESLTYFRRSISMNPGEAGTASAEQAARDGIKAAEALLKRRVMRKTSDDFDH